MLGRADRFVETEARFLPLAQRLLGRTWFVEKLDRALELSRSAGRGLTFVTLSGELLEPDGTLVVGPRNAASGLISRRSQLRALEGQLAELQTAIDAAQQSVAQLDRQIAAGREQIDQFGTEHQQTLDALAENRVAITAAEERRTQLDQQRCRQETEQQTAVAQHDAARATVDRSSGPAKAARFDAGRHGIASGTARPADRPA